VTNLRISVCLIFVVSLFVAPTLIGQTHRVPFRNDPSAVIDSYDVLSSLDAAGQRRFIATLDTTLREDLWSQHIEIFLQHNPQLTPEQRSVAYEALGLVQSGVFEISRSAADWDIRVGQPLARLEHEARQVFTPAEARALLVELAPPAFSPRRDLRGRTDSAGRGRSDGFWDDCNCSSESNWCDAVTNPDNSCKGPCRAQHGCGTLWLYECNGLCQ